jgi:hypothetical protein
MITVYYLFCSLSMVHRSLYKAVHAGVAKLEYARDLGSRGRETVRVRVPPSAPSVKTMPNVKAQGSKEIQISNYEI